ncbi:MAG: Sel1 domain-containing protein [Alphaproteobacteria bacterium]|nr:MAG: Sel1 domain-containing protein [Caulobacteraceae bacterium]TPW03443.1 MAG: Sel1 domain-containing protein [Alphaproteobacteria bacterium]
MPDTPPAGAARLVTPALIAIGVIAAAFLVFQWITPSSPPAEAVRETPAAAQVGPRERYGLTAAEEASLWPGALANRALSSSSLDLVEAAAAEDPLSAGVLCAARFSGQGAPQDDAAAAQACATAKAQGSTIGAYVLSLLTRAGRGGIPADAVAADALLREAAATDARAQHDLAMSLRAAKPAQARGLAEKCAAQGMTDCTFLVARMQQTGEGGTLDTAAALATYHRLTESEYHPAGTRELARMYLAGDGVPRDVAKGVDLLKRAEVLDDPEASYLLGVQAEKGEGVAKDEALAHYRRAAGLGYAPAQDAVARLSGARP